MVFVLKAQLPLILGMLGFNRLNTILLYHLFTISKVYDHMKCTSVLCWEKNKSLWHQLTDCPHPLPGVFSFCCCVVSYMFPVSFMISWSCIYVCCQVIDEIYRVLRYVNSTRAPQRAHEVLQELRDISSMAMEYFDEKIVPILKKKLPGADLSGRLIGSAPGNRCFILDAFRTL